MLAAFTALLGFQLLGEALALLLHLPIPGSVIGMILLFLFLLWRPSVAKSVEPAADTLLKHLSLLFVPAGAGVMTFGARMGDELPALAVTLLVSTVLAIAVTALVTSALMRDGRGDKPKGGQVEQ
ncbi:murein hydrolase transporter LrgA [Robbsia andropogonis]|uniref:Murein hydrolase transporter LrgA n=1 Tax=Robbsia andropogonis TaxID=28092 RepID=A0A0F5JZG6_9BURK|nr:CidA/LrgA family protein [Robbsia andropogonis]KKB63060.1 murein hydrolase transporter LrgA [Robbsia andropogonis]MCP1118374.1 CidA/LrgA family protein [Robbsia andropogonis]MCP1127847.1 CidA/LrgA family protein [Robbsia andropogonis]